MDVWKTGSDTVVDVAIVVVLVVVDVEGAVVENVEPAEVEVVVVSDTAGSAAQAVRRTRTRTTLEISGAAASPTNDETEDETPDGPPDQGEAFGSHAVDRRGARNAHDRR